MFRRKAEPGFDDLPLEEQVARLKRDLERKTILYYDQMAAAYKRQRDLIEYLLTENEALHRLLQAEREHRNHECENSGNGAH